MSGYQVNGTDLDTLFAKYSDVYNTFSAGFTGVSYSNGVNTNIGTTTGYKTSNGYDLSQRYVEYSKLGPSLKKDDSVKYTGSTKYYIGNGTTDIGTLYVAFGKVQWSAAITAITSVALTNSNNVTFSFNFAGYPSKIDAYLTWPNNGTSTTNYGGSLPAIGGTAGGSGSFTVNSLPADTQISYQLRSYISGVDGPNMSYPSTASSFYTHPILSAPTSNSNGIVTSGDSTDYSYTLKGSPDVYQKAAVFTDSGLGNRYNSNEYKPGETITFKSMAPRSDSYTYYLAPYDRNTGNYNSGSDFVKALTFTIGVGSINYDTSTYSGGYLMTATSITVYLANIINVYSVTATATDVTGDTTGIPKGGTTAQKGSIAFTCKPMKPYRISISGYYGDGSKYTFALTPFDVTTPSDVSITNISATSTTTKITVSGTVTNATSVKDSNGNDYSLSNGTFSREYTVDANTQQTYTVTATGTGGSDEKTVSRYTLPSLTAVTSTAGDQQVTITLTGVWGSSNNAQIFNGATQKSATNGSSTFTSGTAYTFNGLTNGTPYSWSVKLYNMNTSAYDVVYTSSNFAGLSFTPKLPGSIVPDGGPTSTEVSVYSIKYITSNTTLKFTGSYFYYFIVVGDGGNGGQFSDSNEGGGGGGGVVSGWYKSTVNDEITITYNAGDNKNCFVITYNNTSLISVGAGLQAGFNGNSDSVNGGYAGKTKLTSDTTLLSQWYQNRGGANYNDFTKFFTEYDSNFRGQSQRNSLSPYVQGDGEPGVGNWRAGGGGAGAGGSGYNTGDNGEGAVGGEGYIWFQDRVTYARGGSTGNMVSSYPTTTPGSGGSTKPNTNGARGVFAIAWRNP